MTMAILTLILTTTTTTTMIIITTIIMTMDIRLPKCIPSLSPPYPASLAPLHPTSAPFSIFSLHTSLLALYYGVWVPCAVVWPLLGFRTLSCLMRLVHSTPAFLACSLITIAFQNHVQSVHLGKIE
jgi:hypothetical protein